MKNKLFGIDFGTGGCKATIIDTSGNVLAKAFEEYPSIHLNTGWSEQDPSSWIEAFIKVIKTCREILGDDFTDILAISVTASTHNAVLLDEHNEVIRNTIMWNDQRSIDQSEKLKNDYGDMIFNIAMQMPSPTWTLPQLMWIKENEIENYKKIKKILFVKDYVRNFITGDFFTDIVDAQGSLLYDAKNYEWSEDICNIISLPLEVLPEVKRSKDIVGYVKQKELISLGLESTIAVIAGCSDTAAEDFGAGAVKKGQIIVKMATAGNVNIISDSANPHSKTFTYPYSVDEMWYTVTGTNTSAASYRWLRDSMYLTEKYICEEKCEDVYKLMDKNASEIEVGSEGLIFHPYLLGERCPYFNPKARANFFGISMMHNKKHFTRAVLEGVAFTLYDCLLVLADFNKDLKDIRIIGGGAKSPLWCQIVCDVFGLSVQVPSNAESSFGGALLAGVGIGVFENEIDAVNKCVSITKTYKPNMDNHKKYNEIFKIYKLIVEANTPIWDALYKSSLKSI